MKNTILLLLLSLIFCSESIGQVNTNTVWVNGYTKSNGTYVQGHYRTAPNKTINDNFSTFPNVNPYTGVQGTIAPEPTSISPTLFENSVQTPTYVEPSTFSPSTFNISSPNIYTPISTPSTDIWGGGGIR